MKQDKNHSTIETPERVINKEISKKEMILWWEKRRLIYNVFLIGFSALLIYNFWDYPMRTIIGSEQIISNAIVFVFGANLFYSLGWGLEILRHNLYKANGLNKNKRWTLFTLGTFFSLIWTNQYFVIEFDVLFAY